MGEGRGEGEFGMDNMRVAMYYNNNDIRTEQKPVPQIGPAEILVKVISSGICGSDVMEWYRIKKAPLVLGHEIAGEIVQVGKDVTRYKVGERVFVSHHIPCNACDYCLAGHHTACDTLHTTNFDPGGFAQYIRVPELNVRFGVFVLPDEISFDEGVFIEPLACVVRAQRIARILPGQSVAILGGGISGLLHLLLAKALGAGKIIVTDVDQYRLDMAKKLGAEIVINAKDDVPRKIRETNGGKPVNLIIVSTGAKIAFSQAMESVERGGTIMFFAPTTPGENLLVPFNDFWRNGITLTTSYGNSPCDAVTAIELIRSDRINVKGLITHKLPLEETLSGFKLVTEAKNSIKVIINP